MLFNPIPHDPTLASLFRADRRPPEPLIGAPGNGRSMPLAFALYRRDGALLVRTSLPGFDATDIALEIEGNALTLSGSWPLMPDVEHARAQHLERPRGAFARTLRLPFEIDAARVQARIERGVLEVELPRLEKAPPVRIPVHASPTP